MEKYRMQEVLIDRKCAAPRFVIKPQSTFTLEGQSARFTCRIISLHNCSVTWYYNNTELRQSVKYMKRYIGDDYTFIINRCKVEDRGEFIIHAENHYGVTEEPVFLNVQPVPKDLPRYEPEPLPVRKRELNTYKLYKEDKEAPPIFTFHLQTSLLLLWQSPPSHSMAEGREAPGSRQVPDHPHRRCHHHRDHQLPAWRLRQIQVYRHQQTRLRQQ